jgi:hypothetical protein
MIKLVVIVLFVSVVIVGCRKEEKLPKQLIAVDGKVEEGDFPFVSLTGSTDYVSVIDSSVYFDVVMTKAKITVWTDDESEVLILFRDNNYFPQNFYRANQMRGKAGKTYHLEIILNGDTITSQTTIPPHVPLQTIKFERDKSDTSKGFIWIGFNDPADQTNYYRAFTKIYGVQKQFTATHISVLDDKSFNGKYIEYPLYKGLNTNTDKTIDFRFQTGDTIDVKFCTMDKASFDFWTGYEREMLNAGNPFGAEGQNLKSNINGGIGVWSGYGVSLYRIVTK